MPCLKWGGEGVWFCMQEKKLKGIKIGIRSFVTAGALLKLNIVFMTWCWSNYCCLISEWNENRGDIDDLLFPGWINDQLMNIEAPVLHKPNHCSCKQSTSHFENHWTLHFTDNNSNAQEQTVWKFESRPCNLAWKVVLSQVATMQEVEEKCQLGVPRTQGEQHQTSQVCMFRNSAWDPKTAIQFEHFLSKL